MSFFPRIEIGITVCLYNYLSVIYVSRASAIVPAGLVGTWVYFFQLPHCLLILTLYTVWLAS